MKKITKILLVDDDVLMLYIKSRMLMQNGYEVYTSENAIDIFATVAKYNPDIIIMDHNMPVVSGMDAIKQLKANPLTNPIRVIYYSLVDDIAEVATEAGADAYTSKSSTNEELINIIESLTK